MCKASAWWRSKAPGRRFTTSGWKSTNRPTASSKRAAPGVKYTIKDAGAMNPWRPPKKLLRVACAKRRIPRGADANIDWPDGKKTQNFPFPPGGVWQKRIQAGYRRCSMDKRNAHPQTIRSVEGNHIHIRQIRGKMEHERSLWVDWVRNVAKRSGYGVLRQETSP